MTLFGSSHDDDFAEYGSAGFAVARSFLSREVVVSGRHGGIAFRHYKVPKSRGTSAYVVLAIKTSMPGELVVEPEGAATKLAKGLGMVEEFQTGDAELDDKYYFSGTTDEYVREVFSNPQNLDLTRRILATRCTRLEKADDELRASAPGQDFLPVAEIIQIVEALAAFRLPSEVHGLEREAVSGRDALGLVMSAIVLIAAPGYWGLTRTKPLINGGWTFASHEAPLLALFTVALLLFAYFMLRGHSMQARLFLGLLLLSPLLVAAFAGALMIVNERFDRSEATPHQTRLLHKYATHSRRGSHYHLVFRSWRGRGSEDIEVDDGTYLIAATRPRLWELRTREGRLGEPWVESIDMPTRPQDVRSPQ